MYSMYTVVLIQIKSAPHHFAGTIINFSPVFIPVLHGLDPCSECWPNLDPDPRMMLSILRKKDRKNSLRTFLSGLYNVHTSMNGIFNNMLFVRRHFFSSLRFHIFTVARGF